MSLPIDIPAVFKAAGDIKDEAAAQIAVSVFVDDTAPGDLVGHVRSAFACADENTRVTISYLGDDMPCPYEADDMAVIVAGVNERVGEYAAYLRSCGLPVMVVTTLPELVGELASVLSVPIPDGDIVAPAVAESAADPSAAADADATAGEGAAEGADADVTSADGAAADESDDAYDEPIILDKKAAASLDMRMGGWVITACHARRIAFAHSFAFVRRPLALDSVNATSLQNAVVGVVPFVPGADMPIMTLNQAKMLLQIAAAYGQKLGLARVKEIAVVVAGGFVCRGVARTVAGVVPVIGWAVRGVVGYTGTQAMGHAAIDYFAGGGDIVGLASIVQSARDAVVNTTVRAAHSPLGKSVLDGAKSIATGMFNRILKRPQQ